MKTINTVIQDVYDMMDSQECTGDLNKVADAVGKEVSESLVNALTPREKKKGLRMSGIGKCERSQWYDQNDYEQEPISGQVYLTFLQGHILESVLLGLVELSGHEVTGKQGKHTIHDINGSQDCEIDGELVDVKTASNWSFNNKFSEDGIKEDSFGYIKQLSAYGKGNDRDKGYFLAFNKNNSQLKLCEQKLEKDVDTFIVDLKGKMELSQPPMRRANATTVVNHRQGGTSCKLEMTCAFCGHKKHCFPELTKRESGGYTTYYDGPYAGPGANF
jgi:hypothetical protein